MRFLLPQNRFAIGAQNQHWLNQAMDRQHFRCPVDKTILGDQLVAVHGETLVPSTRIVRFLF